MKSKYQEAFDQFKSLGTKEEIQAAIDKILEENFEKNNNKEVYKFLYSTIDLTTLTAMDTDEKVEKMVGEVNERAKKYNKEELPPVAAICVYPARVAKIKEKLTVPEVKIAAVSGGFPASQTFLDVKVVETSFAVAAGANEIDIVLNLAAFLENDYQQVCEEIEEQKEHAGKALLKVILETGALDTVQIRKAAILGLFSSADFLKTSTGKEYPGATLEAAYILCQCIKEYAANHGREVGVKFSGGIRTAEDAVKYYTLVKAILGDKWLNNKLFRIGASSLEKNLREAILKSE